MKPFYRYQIDFNGKWIRWSLLSMAISFFFFMMYTFGVSNLATAGFLKALFVMLIPTALSACYVVFLKIKELNAPGIYGLIGAGICLGALMGTFYSGSAIRIIMGLIWYPICVIMLLCCVGGYLPSVVPAAVVFGVTIFVRIFYLLFAGMKIDVLASELAFIFSFAAFVCLAFGLKQGRMKNEINH